MINFKVFFKIHFDSERIGDDDIKRYAQSHIERITANNTGSKYDVMLTDTTKAYTDFYNAISAEVTNEGIKQAATQSVDAILADFKTEVSFMEGVIRNAFRTSPSVIQEFFPYGLSEYSNATKSNIEMMMDRMVNACANNTARLPAGFDTNVKNLRQSYINLRSGQLQKIGTVADNKAQAATLRNTLERQLNLNLLDIAKEYLGDPVNGLKFFDQSILKTDTSKPGEPGQDGIIYTGQVGPEAKVTVTEGGFKATSVITVENSGETILNIYTAAKADDPVPENAPEL
ncbi:MAG: hypothetical protein FJY07_06540, partial [Bacteroidetes bacterium]|nr:hypothetical protein [Bacteroidota bacterium]